MRRGFIEITEVKCLLVGPAGVGKTCVKYLILRKPPPHSRTSTACRDRPVRVVRVSKLGGEWKEIDEKLLEELLAQSILLLGHNYLDNIPTDLLRHVQQNPEDEVLAAEQGPISQETELQSRESESNESDDEETKSQSSLDEGSLSDFSFGEESGSDDDSTDCKDPTRRVLDGIIQHLTTKGGTSEGIDSLFNAELLYFIDSGGQPAFHDLIPLFVQNTTAAIFVHRLCEALDDYPADEFFKDGERVGPSKKAPATNMDILKCMAQTIHTQLHEGKLPSFLTVGTFRDLEHKCKETRKEKNKKLYEFLHPLFPDLVLNGDSLNPIFAFDAANPTDTDKQLAEVVREAIQKSASKKKYIPIWWYVLELILSMLSKTLERKVLKYDECFAEAMKLNFTEDAFKAALSYLHDLNLILYYPKCLPNVVFSDAQVPVAILTALVETWYRLQAIKEGTETSESMCARDENWIKFRDQGIVTMKFLSSEEFRHLFYEGFFSPGDFLKLLKGVLAATPLSKNEFFVPAFTTRLPLPGLTTYMESQPISSSFAVCFKSGCAAAGVFCCSIVHLQLQSGWEIIQDPNKCLARNCMQFELPDSITIVTIVDHYRFFRVCIDVPEEENMKDVVTQVRSEVFEAIKAAAKNLKYSNCTPSIGFQCLQDDDYHKTTPHSVILTKKGFWKCPHDARIRGKLKESQSIWLDEETKGL